MPSFASLMASLMGGLVGFLARFLSLRLAQRIAAYTTYITTTVLFLAVVLVCLSSLKSMVWGMFSGISGPGNWLRYLAMGVSMFIPANAGAVLSCCASVWIGTSIYKVQKQGLHNYGS